MGLPALAGAWGRYIGFCLGYGHIWPKIKSDPAGKNILHSIRPTMPALPASIGVLLLMFGWCHACFSVPTAAHASNAHVCESYGSKNNFVYPFEAPLAPGRHPGFSYAWARAGARAHARRARARRMVEPWGERPLGRSSTSRAHPPWPPV